MQAKINVKYSEISYKNVQNTEDIYILSHRGLFKILFVYAPCIETLLQRQQSYNIM